MNNNIIIIGGGLGALFTGAFLAKNNYHVTIIEKNHIIGGGLQCFKRRGELFETGMHVLGGFQKGGALNKICNYLDITDQLSIRDMDDEAIDSIHYLSDDVTYYIPKGRHRFVSYFASLFPHERDNIARYVDQLYRLADEVDLFYLRKSSDSILSHSNNFMCPADELISHYIQDPKLRDVLAYMNPMYGGVAHHTPAYIHALINVLYIDGASRFNDGSQQLADALSRIITDGGGQIIIDSKVIHIHVADKSIQYVETAQGDKFTADTYISDIHPCTLTGIMSAGAFPRSYISRLADIPNTYSAFTVYIIFKEDTFPYINHTCYYQTDYGMVWQHDQYDATRWPRGFMYITPSTVNQGRFARKMIVNCIMDFNVVQQWAGTVTGRRGSEYEQWKAEHTQKIINHLAILHPGIKDMIEYAFASSPLTIRDYYGVKDGSLYGFRKDSSNIMLSQVPIYTKVKNLLLTGQNINLHGICGVPLTAIQTAEALIGHGVLLDKINAAYVE